MKQCYLLDPWLLELKPEDSRDVRFKRLTSLKKLIDLNAIYDMTPVKFVDDEFRTSLMSNRSTFQRQEWGEVGKIIAHTSLGTKAQGLPVEIIDTPCHALSAEGPLSAQWLTALNEHGCGEDPPVWRRPIIIFSETRSTSWPNHDEKNRELKYKINGSTEPTARNLVCIENYNQHTYFETDLDPWRIGAFGTPDKIVTGAVSERREATRRLPRPLQLLPLNLTFTKIWEKLQVRLDWSCGEAGRAYFIPPTDWDPRTIDREEWRGGRIFRTVSLSQPGRYPTERGIVDRESRIWVWDKLKNHHWDVQLTSGSHINVTHEGVIVE